MRNFQVTVNGKKYDVSVSELDSTIETVYEQTLNLPTALEPEPELEPEPTPAPPPASARSPKTAPDASAGKEIITSPMPGKILSVKVKVGQKVQSGDLILYLEAMKMENEIFCGEDGTVIEILVKEGDTVNPGEVLVIID